MQERDKALSEAENHKIEMATSRKKFEDDMAIVRKQHDGIVKDLEERLQTALGAAKNIYLYLFNSYSSIHLSLY